MSHLTNNDLSAVAEILQGEGYVCRETSSQGKKVLEVTSGDRVVHMRVGDGRIMSTGQLEGIPMSPSHHGLTWNYYVEI